MCLICCRLVGYTDLAHTVEGSISHQVLQGKKQRNSLDGARYIAIDPCTCRGNLFVRHRGGEKALMLCARLTTLINAVGSDSLC